MLTQMQAASSKEHVGNKCPPYACYIPYTGYACFCISQNNA